MAEQIGLEKAEYLAVPVVLASSMNKELSQNAPLKILSLRHNAGTLDAGNLIANTIFKRIQLIVNGSDVYIDLLGEEIADIGSVAVKLWRNYVNYKNGYYGGLANEFYEIRLIDAIPAGVLKKVIGEFASVATVISDSGSATTYTGATIDVYTLQQDLSEDNWFQERNFFWDYTIGTSTSITSDLPALQGEQTCSFLIFGYEDGGTFANTGKIELKIGNITYFEGSLSALRNRAQEKAKYGLETGVAILDLPDVQWQANQAILTWSHTSAPTAGKIHVLGITNQMVALQSA